MRLAVQILSFLLLITTIGFSQNINESIIVYFNSGTSKIAVEEQGKLKIFIDSLPNYPSAFSVKLYGHSDNSGTPKGNLAISKKRANSVAKALANSGFNPQSIEVIPLGDTKPLNQNSTEEGKAKNRRVECRLFPNSQKPKSIGGYTLKPNIFQVSNAKGDTLFSKTTIIKIPPNAFVYKNGMPVKGNVQVEYTSYDSPIDFIFAEAPMRLIKNGEVVYFDSKGMFKIDAKQEGEQLKLKPGTKIDVKFNAKAFGSETDLYKFNDGDSSWTKMDQNPDQMRCVPVPVFDMCSYDCSRRRILKTLRTSFKNKSIDSTWKAAMHDTIGHNVPKLIDDMQPLYDKSKAFSSKKSNYRNTLKNYPNQYKLSAFKKGKKFVEFKLKSQTLGLAEEDDLKPLKDVLWKVKITKNNQKTISKLRKGKNDVSRISIVKEGKFFTMSISVSDTSKGKSRLTLKKVKAKLNSKPFPKATPDSLISLRRKSLDKVFAGRDSVNQMMQNMNDSIDATYSKLNRLKKIHHQFIRLDSLECFYNTNLEYQMGGLKYPIKMENWFMFYDMNKDTIGKHIDSLSQGVSFAHCLPTITTNLIVDKEISDALKASGINMRITSLGTYNADAISRIKKPITIFGNYYNEAGEKLKITQVYVFDKSINGVMRFDGYGGWGPRRFRVSKTFAISLIAFDGELNAYIIPKKEFQKIIKGKNPHKKFYLKKVNKSDSKQELEHQLY